MDGGSVDYAGAIIDRSMRVPFLNRIRTRAPVGEAIWGKIDVQDARMLWVHGCAETTFRYFLSFKEKFCTWMYLCCDRMDAKEQRTRRSRRNN